MTEFNSSPSRELLQEHILPDDELREAEEQFPGLLRVLSATRTHARLLADGDAWEFILTESDANNARFELQDKPQNRPEDIEPLFWEHAWHRAAEAILAVRQGHREYHARMREKKAREELQDGP